MVNFNVIYFFLESKHFKSTNLYYKIINNNLITFIYKLKNLVINGLYLKSPSIRLINNFKLIDNEKKTYQIQIPLLDCSYFYNLFLNLDTKLNDIIRGENLINNTNYKYLSFLNDDVIVIKDTSYTYTHINLEFDINTTIIKLNNQIITSIKLEELNINNIEITFFITINGMINSNANYTLKYKVNEINLKSNLTFDNINYYEKNYLFKNIVNKFKKQYPLNTINKQNFNNTVITDNNVVNDDNNVVNIDNNNNNNNNDNSDYEKDSDDELISFPNFELEFD